MPAVKTPCLQCKEKHVRCDEQRPTCNRCRKKRLECTRPSKSTMFRHNSSASFSRDQKWVNSAAKKFEFDSRASTTDCASEVLSPPVQGASTDSEVTDSATSPVPDGRQATKNDRRHPSDASPVHFRLGSHSGGMEQRPTPGTFWDPPPPMPMPVPNNNHMPLLPALHGSQESVTLAPIWPENANHGFPRDNWSVSHQASAPAPQHMSQSPHGSELRTFPLQDVQEACLLKYYVEEIGHWLDLADEDRHFQLVVPVRARSQPHLLNSIFAVAARHLCRMPQYRTAQGIEYMGQLLPHLDKHSAVEYTLKCIPALRNFHEAHDDEYRDSIIATAVILRQLEEIDDEDDGSQHPDRLSTLGPHSTSEQINFLPIIDSVLRSPPSQTLFGRRSLIRAAYWMALRQEIYHSFTRRQAPQLILASDYWPTASNANKAVMHTVQVVRWLWGDGTEQEWKRLVKQQDHVEQDVLESFRPIFRKQPDRTRGEIFPTVWYASNIEVTSNQQAMMAKSVLLAENPALKGQSASRSSVRQAESDVRALILELCGAALCPPASPPAILNAAFVIQMYGDFFTDPYERQALGVIVAKYRATNAWPSQKLTEMFG